MVALLIKKIVFLSLLIILSVGLSFVSIGIDISAASAVVINAETKEIIFEKNAFQKRSMASTTKIMTSILAIESGNLHDRITVTSKALTEGTSIGIKDGDVLSLEAIVYGMMLESGNDAANMCALHLSGSYEAFAGLMNKKAESIGMLNTSFVTPSGLDNEKHYSTAFDMALLGAYSIRNPTFREICSCKRKTINFIKPELTATFLNHNKLLDSCEGVFGIKTGFTKKSGRCLVTACERNGAELVCVTLSAPDDWNDHRKLYDLSFAELNKATVKFTRINKIPVYGSSTEELEVYSDDFIYHYLENSDVNEQIIIPKFVYAPIKENEIIGKVNYYSDGSLIHTSFIYSKNDVDASDETFNERFTLIEQIKNIFLNRKD